MQVEELFAKLGIEIDHTAFAKANALLEGLNLKFLAIGGAVAATVGALVHVTTEVRDAGFEASKAAQRTGLTVEAWQELKAAGEASGISAESMEHALGILSKTAYEAAHGGSELATAFQHMGVETTNADGSMRGVNKILLDLAERYAELPDGIEKTALAQKLLSRGGRELIPFLNKGKEGIQELIEHAHELGLVLDEETIAASKEWKKSMIEFGETVEGLKYRIGSALLKAFVSAKREASKFFAVIGAGIKSLRQHWALFAPLVAALTAMLLYRLGAALILNTGLMTTLTALTTAWGQASLIAGARAALAPVLAAAPWLLLLGVIGLVAEDIQKALTGGRSVFGEWTKFLKEDPGDSPFVQELKRELRMLTDIQGTIQNIIKLKDQLFAGFSAAAGLLGKGRFGDAASVAAYSVLSAGQTIGDMDSQHLNQKYPQYPFMAPGETPQPRVSNSSRTSNAALSIGQINITSSDPKEAASEVQKHLENFWEQKTSTAAGGVD